MESRTYHIISYNHTLSYNHTISYNEMMEKRRAPVREAAGGVLSKIKYVEEFQ